MYDYGLIGDMSSAASSRRGCWSESFHRLYDNAPAVCDFDVQVVSV